MIKVVAVLETMWDWEQQTSGAGYRQAPRFFRINPRNHSGRRLYKLIGPDAHLLVTEACKELATHANQHGKPDPDWLYGNLVMLEPFDILLVCGLVARQTYQRCGYHLTSVADVVYMPHPAARQWTRQMIDDYTAQIERIKNVKFSA